MPTAQTSPLNPAFIGQLIADLSASVYGSLTDDYGLTDSSIDDLTGLTDAITRLANALRSTDDLLALDTTIRDLLADDDLLDDHDTPFQLANLTTSAHSLITRAYAA